MRTPLLFVAAVLASLPVAQAAEEAGIFLREPYLQCATTSSVRILWRTSRPILPVIRYGKSRSNLDGVLPTDSVLVRRTEADGPSSPGTQPLHSAPEGTWQFEAEIAGLEPDTQYYYAIFDMDQRLTPDDGTWFLRTLAHAGANRPFAFWVVGDSGTNSKSQKAVTAEFLQWRDRHRKTIDFYVHVGDMAYNRGLDSEFQFGFFNNYAPILRNTVCWPSMGNHEGATSKGESATGPYYDAYSVPVNGEAGGLPSGTEAYYSWDYGNTHFICLNSHDLSRSPEGAMARWFKADLERTRAEWIIAYWHHPPYTKGSHNSDREKDLTEIREWILPIAESGGVDLVLTGHSHIYERSMLIDGAYDTPTIAENKVFDDGDGDPKGDGPYRKRPGGVANEGTVQVVAGHGGQALGRRPEPSPVMHRTIVEWGSVVIEVNGNTLTGTMIDARGKERDRFQLVKDATKPPVRIANPKPPLPPEGPERLREFVP